MKLLITGANGLYGSKFARLAVEKKCDVYSGYNQELPAYGTAVHFDVSDKIKVDEAFKKVNPEVVVHAATLTDVDKCETNKELAWKINVDGTKNIVDASKRSHAFLVYISTDYVFNGEKGQYKETDTPDPINYYGLTKLKAEALVQNLMDESCIARTSVIYGDSPAAGKTNFALWLLDKFKRKEEAKTLTDQWNSPTLNTNMAEMTLEIIERKLTGIYNISGATRISRYDFAKLLAQTFNMETDLIMPSTMAEFSWPAKRPRDSSLDTSKAQRTLKNQPLQIHEAFQQLKKELSKSSP